MIKPSVYLEDYGDGFDERVSVVLLCRDAMSAGVQVRLRLTVKCQNGVTLRTKSHAVFSPITLYHGTPDRLGAAELAPYFDVRNLDVTGSLVNGAMPEGVAQFSVEVLEYYTGVPLSLPASTVTNLTLARPPTLLFPRNGATLRFSEPLSIIFSWSVRSSIAAGDTYEFLLKEIADTNANPTSAFSYSQTIFRTETFATSIVYSVSEPPLEPGKTYAWCVRLMNSHAVNGGWSEVFTFRLDETEGVDGGEQSADAVTEPKRRSGECGEDSYRVTDLTPCDTPLSVGDTMTVGGGFPVIVREIAQRGERFYGRGLMYVPYIGVSFAVSINGVRVNCLKQMIEGYTEVEHDASSSQIGGTDALLHGGATKLKNGVVMPDLAVDFTFPKGMKAALDSDAGTLVLYDTGGNVAGSVEMPRNEQGEPVFPVRVKDADGKIVQIDKAGDEGSEEGELTVTHIGKANSSELVHPRVTAYLRPDYGVVEFGDADGSRFSFDAALPYYESVAILLNSDGAGGGGRVYRKMNDNYIVPWKFLSTGSTDKVTAKLTLTDEGKKLIKPEKLQFKTVTEAGTVTLPSDYDASRGLYTVQVTAAQPHSKTSVYALYPYNGADYYLNLGVIDIDTRSTLEAKVCIVDIGGSANIQHIETELNAIYSKVGVHWSVTRENGLSYHKDSIAHLFDSRSKALELYNSHQKNLNRAFETYLGDRYDGSTCYLFMMPANGSGSKRELAGFMPRGEQYGYINTDAVKSENLPAVIAHELGHGKYRLRHTFDSEYGSAAERKKGGTDNLMDYTSSPYKSTHIAKWQWNQIYNPALLTEVWEKDEDSEWVVQVAQCLTGAAIDVVINYGFKWAELLMDGYPVEFTDYEKIFSEMNTAEVVTSAGVACATSVIPFPVDKSKANLIASFSAALGAGATAVAANLETQYNDIQRQYPDKSFNEVLSAVNWAEVLKNVGVQAVISGIATSVTIYATTHPKFIAFKDNLKKIGYAALHKRLVKAGLDDGAIDEFCKKFGIRTYSLEKTTIASIIREDGVPISKETVDIITRNAVSYKTTDGKSIICYTKNSTEAIVIENGNVFLQPKGARPDPSDYLTKEYIDSHLAKFKDGVSCLALDNAKKYATLGRQDGLFVLPKNEMDKMLARTGDNIAKIEKELGIPAGNWMRNTIEDSKPQSVIRIDINANQISNLRIPNGNEIGANSMWIPGGYTINGVSEAVIDAIKWSEIQSNQIKIIIKK